MMASATNITVTKVHDTNNTNAANAYIAAGWVLLSVGSGIWQESGEPCAKYVLGWTLEGQPVTPPGY